jgi:iron(III) transport system ATP-binding protein
MSDIRFKAVRKAYGDKVVLDELDLHIRSGECFVLVGPSGCGKTVALRLIAGFEKPDRGEISIGDRIVASGKASVAPEERRIGVVFQDYAVWPHKTVAENVVYPLQMQKVDKESARSRAATAIAQVNLTGYEGRFPSQLSGGQQQRVALARALVAAPEVMLLDEPLTNLDANLREEMRFEIKDLQRTSGMTILYVTHDHEVALAIADRIAVMDQHGAIRQVGAPSEVYEHPVDPFVCRFLGVSSFVPAIRGGGEFVIEGTEVSLGTCPVPALAGAEKVSVAFRPMDIGISRPGADRPANGSVERMSLLGPIVDYLVRVGGHAIRCQVQTEEAIARDLLIPEGAACVLDFFDAKWFAPEATSGEEA